MLFIDQPLITCGNKQNDIFHPLANISPRNVDVIISPRFADYRCNATVLHRNSSEEAPPETVGAPHAFEAPLCVHLLCSTSTHLMASASVTLPRYVCVVFRSACLRKTFDTTSRGTPLRLAYVAECLLRSWGGCARSPSRPTFL